MNNTPWNQISSDVRLRLWKTLRTDIAELSLEEQLQQLAIFCANMPYGARTVDYYDPESWPTPWEILFYGSFCTSSISLLMYYTLTMPPVSADASLYLVEDVDGIYLLPVIGDHHVLNYQLSKVNKYQDIEATVTVLKKYTKEDIKTIT